MSQAKITESARAYAASWLTKEQHFVAGLATRNRQQRLAALQRAGGYFRVSRSFGLQFDVERGLDRLAPALDVLDRIDPRSVSHDTLADIVRRLRGELGQPYGGKDLLSAATKFLWPGHRDYVIIHDSQVRAALGASYGDYDGYLAVWRAEYGRRRTDVAAACDELEGQRGQLGRDANSIARQEWFRRRVLDIFLWKAGAPGILIAT